VCVSSILQTKLFTIYRSLRILRLILFQMLSEYHKEDDQVPADPCGYNSWPEPEYRSHHRKEYDGYQHRPQQVYSQIDQENDPHNPQYCVQHLFLYYKKSPVTIQPHIAGQCLLKIRRNVYSYYIQSPIQALIYTRHCS
jgi:hypothetical protein